MAYPKKKFTNDSVGNYHQSVIDSKFHMLRHVNRKKILYTSIISGQNRWKISL